MVLRLKIFFLFVFIFSFSQAQNTAVGQWRTHLPYTTGLTVAEANDKIYCAAINGGLFIYDKTDNHVESLSKVNGLSDVKIATIRYNSAIDALLIAYDNTNLDIVKGTSIINISDIKRKNIVGNKKINSISFFEQYAYLSCGFGIVVVDMLRFEIKDTYTLLSGGTPVEVYDVANDGTSIYAATSDGLYKAPSSNQNLANSDEWVMQTSVPTDTKYIAVNTFNNKVYAILSASAGNTLYMYDGTSWGIFDSSFDKTMRAIEVFHGKLLLTNLNGVRIYNAPGGKADLSAHYVQPWFYPNDVVLDKDGVAWAADLYSGFLKIRDQYNFELVKMNGPLTKFAVALAAGNDDVWATPGGKNASDNNLFIDDGVFYFDNTQWTTFNKNNIPGLNGIYDIVNITLDPNDSKRALLSTWNTGLVDFKIGEVPKRYTEKNSSLQSAGVEAVRIPGCSFDSKGNLWVMNSIVNSPLSVMKKDGQWKSFTLGDSFKGLRMSKILVDKEDRKWIIPLGFGILVYDDNNTIDDASDDRTRILNTKQGEGNLPDVAVNCMTLDHENAIWIGTDKGIGVFYNPENIFTNPDAQRVLIEQDGQLQNLLESEVVTAIAVDGGNRKWIGTRGSGVYLMSPDGTKEVSHFQVSNSPLLSNSITSIAINNKSGEVFFGTDEGIVSYRGTATEGKETYDSTYVFPNPVRPGYVGPIAIHGLVSNVNVKIADVSGNIVYETTAIGGQAIWDGNTLQGQRVSSGVYMVFCSNEDGTQTFVTKILFVN